MALQDAKVCVEFRFAIENWPERFLKRGKHVLG